MADRNFRSARLIEDNDVTKKSIPKPSKAIPCRASDDPAETHRNYAQAIVGPEVSAFRIVSACEQPGLKEQLDTPALIRLLKDRGEAVNNGDLSHAEQMLAAQATALQSLFARLTERAMEQTTMPNIEGFMRLALRGNPGGDQEPAASDRQAGELERRCDAGQQRLAGTIAYEGNQKFAEQTIGGHTR